MPNPIQAVIFDQDGLMFDTESLAATSWFEVGPKYGIHVDGNFLRGIRGCKPDKVKQVCTQQFGEEAMKDYDRFREEKRQYSYRWIAEHGVPVKKGLKELPRPAVKAGPGAMSGEPAWRSILTITYTGTW